MGLWLVWGFDLCMSCIKTLMKYAEFALLYGRRVSCQFCKKKVESIIVTPLESLMLYAIDSIAWQM